MNRTITTRPIRRAGGSAALEARDFLRHGLRAVLISCAVLNLACAEDTVPRPMSPPDYTQLRYDENYGYLKDPAARQDLIDKFKYIPLQEPGDSYLTLGGESRDRYENFHNYVFGDGPQDSNGYNLLRVMLHADLHLGPRARVFVEGINATEQGRFGGPRSSDVNHHDLYQAFAEGTFPLGANTSFTLRGGRQAIAFGAQRLIGVSDFSNVRRTFDGVRGTLTTPGNKLDVFYARPVRVRPDLADDVTPGTSLAGIYDTWTVPGAFAQAGTKLELYALHGVRQSITFNQTTAGETRDTFGVRVTANPKPFDYDLEADYQAGRFNGQATRAFSLAAIGGYTFSNAPCTPRTFLGFDLASGGSRNHPGDTFDQLFPSGHDKFGLIDAIGRQNIIDVHPGFTLTLLKDKPGAKQLTLLAQYRRFWRENDQGAVYTSSGSILRTGGGSSARAIGGETDLQISWQLDRHVSAYAGHSLFSPGPFIAATGPVGDIHFFYSALTITF
jgi:hypothetical protein